MRILISAYACTPGRGSEPGVGWNRVCQAARFHEVWAITREKNRTLIESELAKEPMPQIHFIYHDLPRWARFWKKHRRGIHLYYYLWQLTAYFRAKELHHRVAFDQVQHVTFCNYWMPSFMALLPAPFVWGPVGGGEATPLSFRPFLRFRGRIFEVARTMAQRIGELDPLLRWTARRAAVALATTPATEGRLRSLGCQAVLVYSEAGLPREEIDLLNKIPPHKVEPFRLVSIGDLLHLKGFELGLRAFALFHSCFPDSEYWVIGEGPERERLTKLAQKLGVANNVRFLGRIPRQEVLTRLAECDALVHPSLHDSGGWVCLEAMAAGRPVICLDLGGPGVQVNAETGIKVAANSPEQAVADLAGAMTHLAANPDLCSRLGAAGRARIRTHFDWDQKGAWLRDLSSRVLEFHHLSQPLERIQNAG